MGFNCNASYLVYIKIFYLELDVINGRILVTIF